MEHGLKMKKLKIDEDLLTVKLINKYTKIETP